MSQLAGQITETDGQLGEKSAMYGEQETTLRKWETELRALEKLMKEKIGNADIIKVSLKMDPLCIMVTLNYMS